MVKAKHMGGSWRENIELRSSKHTGLIVMSFNDRINGIAIDPASAVELAFELIKEAFNLQGTESEKDR